MLKLIAFDWDCTLADSLNKIIACKQFLARKYNLPLPSEEVIRNVLGTKFEDALVKCFPNATQAILEQVGTEFHILMQQDSYQATLFPGVKEILVALKERRIKLTVATAKNRKELDKAILYNSLSGMFDLTCCSSEHQSKPDPAMLNYIMQKFNVQRDECLMIGDTTTDILFSANAAVKAIGVTFGAHSREKLQSENPFALIEQWSQLLGVIEKCYSIYPPYP